MNKFKGAAKTIQAQSNKIEDAAKVVAETYPIFLM